MKTDVLHLAKHKKLAISKEINEMKIHSKKWCPFNHNKEQKTNISCYFSHETIKSLIEFLKIYEKLFSYLEIDSNKKEELNELIINIKDPRKNKNWINFKFNMEQLLEFVKYYESNFYDVAKKFTCVESIRLEEALACFDIGAYFSSTIMAISAVEARLHALIRIKNRKLYASQFKDSTLGGILKLFDPAEYKDPKYTSLKKIVPKKHLPLMNILNEYRIFSAHPKDENIKFNLANSILSLSFALLIDKELQLPKKALIAGKAPEK